MSLTPICQCLYVDCSDCFDMNVSYCPSSPININAGQTPAIQIYLWVRDKFGNLYNDFVTVNGDGSVDIDLTHFPKGMFTPEFGSVDMFLTSDADGKLVLPMGTLYPAETFNCIFISVDSPVFLTDDTECFLLTDDNDNILTE